VESEYQARLPSYPVLVFLTRFPRALPCLAALAPLLLGGWITYRTSHADFAVIGLATGIAGYFIARGVLELVELVVELLVPR